MFVCLFSIGVGPCRDRVRGAWRSRAYVHARRGDSRGVRTPGAAFGSRGSRGVGVGSRGKNRRRFCPCVGGAPRAVRVQGAVRGARRRARARACVSLVILPFSGTEPVVCHTGVEALRYAPCVRRLYIHHDVRNADLVAETQTKLILRYVARFFFPFSQCSVPKLEKKITPCVEYITWLSLCVMC